jgi:hypothetical protein
MPTYTTPRLTVQQVLQSHAAPDIKNTHVSTVFQRIKTCRTASLGYHLYQCSHTGCGHIKYQYHSCRNRHCPNCGAVKKQEWIEARTGELLPVKYYHVVFTLPHELNSLVLGHRKLLFKLLFNASAQTLLAFAKDPKYLGATPGIISVLHTWGQQLSFHPHVHCIISGGGMHSSPSGTSPKNAMTHRWKENKRRDGRFLFPVKAMSIVYRAKFLAALQQMIANGEVTLLQKEEGLGLINSLYRKEWVVYAKAPFGGPQPVIEYLGRYTHKVAISNHRISSINKEEQTVSFMYKDYTSGGRQKEMTLQIEEFIRRFAQHILPQRFTKIRTYGYLANRNRHQRIDEILKHMQLPQHKILVTIPLQVRMLEQFGIDISECPCCNNKTLQLVKIFYPWKKGDDG